MSQPRQPAKLRTYDGITLWGFIILCVLALVAFYSCGADGGGKGVFEIAKGLEGGKLVGDLSGKADPLGAVVVKVAGKEVAQAKPSSDGSWSIPLSPDFAKAQAGEVAFVAADGEVGKSIEWGSVAVSSSTPKLTLSVGQGTEPTPVGQVEFSGAGKPGDKVTVSVDSYKVGEAEAAADGTWSVRAEIVKGGKRKVLAKSSSGEEAFADLLMAGKAAAGAHSPAKAWARRISNPHPGARLWRRRYTVFGFGKPGEQVAVNISGSIKGYARVDSTGRWRLRVKTAPGRKVIRARIGPRLRTTIYHVR